MSDRRNEPRARRKSVSRTKSAPSLAPDSIVTRSSAFIEPEQRRLHIAEAAYFKAERRKFDPGHDLDDWLEAEAEIDAALTQHHTPELCDAT